MISNFSPDKMNLGLTQDLHEAITEDLNRGALADGVDEVFVNGDSFISDAKALEPVFKARMFDGVES